MKFNIDDILADALAPSDEPNSLNCQILSKAKETKSMKQKPLRHSTIAAAILCIVIAGSITSIAAYRYLSPKQVAENVMEEKNLAQAFESTDAVKVHESQISNGYNITLLGLVSGSGLTPYVGTDINTDIEKTQTYAVLAIEKEDGSAMPDTSSDDYKTFCISPLIHGKDWTIVNNGTLNAGVDAFTQDGILYELLECDNLEIFSDIGVQLGIVESFGQENQAFTLNKKTGEYSKNPDYTNVNALFTLPLDTSKADAKAAEEYFKQIEKEMSNEEDEEETDTSNLSDADKEMNKWSKASKEGKLTAEYLEKNATPVESSKQILKIDDEGYINWNNSEGSSGTQYVKDWNLKKGSPEVFSFAWSDKPEDIQINTLTLNEDGTFTYLMYVPKKN